MNCINCIHCAKIISCGPDYYTQCVCDLSSSKFIECTYDIKTHFEDKRRRTKMKITMCDRCNKKNK